MHISQQINSIILQILAQYRVISNTVCRAMSNSSSPRTIYYNNTGILCVSVCLCVCLSHLRSCEREAIVPRFLHLHEELHLASCTNRFSSRYNAPLERKGFGSFSEVTHWQQYTPVKTSGYNGHDQCCLQNSRRFSIWGTCPSCVKPKTYPFMNGLVPCTYPTQNLPIHERVLSSWY